MAAVGDTNLLPEAQLVFRPPEEAEGGLSVQSSDALAPAVSEEALAPLEAEAVAGEGAPLLGDEPAAPAPAPL